MKFLIRRSDKYPDVRVETLAEALRAEDGEDYSAWGVVVFPLGGELDLIVGDRSMTEAEALAAMEGAGA